MNSKPKHSSEAMACGTPVIAFRRGAVPEILEDGTSGFIVDTVEEAVTAVPRVASLDRARVRAAFESRFTVERMARDYLTIYRALAGSRPKALRPRKASGTRHSLQPLHPC
jgi:glycosyltransferase involved in cell wall biosynthesis